jgi:hypothetical protein
MADGGFSPSFPVIMNEGQTVAAKALETAKHY